MKKILNLILKTLLPIALGAVILWWIYRDFDFSQVSAVVCNEMNLWWFALSTIFGVLSHMVRGWRWLLTLEPLGYRPSTANCVYAIFIAYGANLVVPRVGEVSRCAVLDRCDGVPFVQSLGTVVAERLIDTVMVLTLVVAALAMQWKIFYT
ncbi:MAG: flippase-like domain-containing protein, partial [Bacteroidaceae bacterium]|nr:flippase-like domain-containing protein [Bacteroidaceae bacterium]